MTQAMDGEPARDFAVPEGIHIEVVDPQTGRSPDNLSRERLHVALTENQMASGTIIERRSESIIEVPVPEQPVGLPQPNEGIIEEDLPNG